MRLALDPAISWTLALGLALLLGAAAIHKLVDWSWFCSVLEGYRILPERVVGLVALVVVATEVGAAVLMLLPEQRARGGALSAGLMLAYAGAIALNLGRGRTRIDCGCPGAVRSERIGWWMVGRNGMLALAALMLWLPVTARPLEGIDWITVLGTVAVAALLYNTLDRLASVSSVRGGSA